MIVQSQIIQPRHYGADGEHAQAKPGNRCPSRNGVLAGRCAAFQVEGDQERATLPTAQVTAPRDTASSAPLQRGGATEGAYHRRRVSARVSEKAPTTISVSATTASHTSPKAPRM